MLLVTYKVELISGKIATNKKEVKSLNDFRLFALSLNLRYEIVQITEIN